MEIYNNKNENFRRNILREFKKPENSTNNPNLFRFRDILVYEIFKEVCENNGDLLNENNNPFDEIEQILFNNLMSNSK